MRRLDEEIHQQDVVDHSFGDSRIDATKITVDVRDGKATLSSGAVHDDLTVVKPRARPMEAEPRR